MSEALMQWDRCESYSEQSLFAQNYFLSMNTLKLLSDMKKQFGENLKQMGFLQSGKVNSIWENRNVDNLALFKAIVAASLYPNIATVRYVICYKRHLQNTQCHNSFFFIQLLNKVTQLTSTKQTHSQHILIQKIRKEIHTEAQFSN